MNNKIYTIYLILVTLILSLFPAQSLLAQTYPVQGNVYLMSPYSKHLNDYYATSKEKLVLTLLNRDQLKPQLEVYLRMTITASNGLKIQSKDEYNYPTITLDAGIPTRLTQDDLAPYFININASGYFDQGKLPDGQIEFTFQVLEKYTKKILSAPASGRVWLSSNKPPILRLPSNDESISFREPMNMKFQWEPQHRNLSQVEYEFELRELPDFGVAPQSAFMYSPTIHKERILYTSLLYDMMMPYLDPNKLYGWRVRAIAKDGVDELNLFDNNGYSEIFWFRTQTNCPAPTSVIADLQGRRLDLNWIAELTNNEFIIQYRPKYGSGTEDWIEITTYENNTSIYDIQRGLTYEYRVGGICTTGKPVFSPIGEIMVPAVDSTRLLRCGIMDKIDLSNKEPLAELKAGDVVMINDYPMRVTRVTGANGNFSGEGWVPVNWLLDTKWAVEFSNIRINTDYRVFEGSVRAKYDENESNNIADIDQITDGGIINTQNGIVKVNVEVSFEIPENPILQYDAETETVIVYTTDGQEVGSFEVKNNGEQTVFPMTIKDKNGNIHKIEEETDENGNVVKDSNGNPVLKSEYIGKEEKPLSDKAFNKGIISAESAIVTFLNSDESKYAFDTWVNEYASITKIGDKYEHLALAKGKDKYNVAWKYLPIGGSDKVTAKIDLKSKDLDLSKVVFRTPQGTVYDAKYDDKNKAFIVSLVAGGEGDVQEVYALYQQSSENYETLGKLNVVTYRPQTNKLVVVQINGNTIDTNSLREYLEKVYGKVAVTWDVSVEDYIYSGNTKGFFEKGSKLLSAYNQNMLDLQATYKTEKGSLISDASYLFILADSGDGKNRDASGFMPRGKQFGYIFKDNIKGESIEHVIAHELGHGRWRLHHTFDSSYGEKLKQGSTNNLMDYTKDGIHLAKWQWDQINDPAWFSNPFDSDEKGMAITPDQIIDMKGETGYSLYLSSSHFMDPSGQLVTLPNNCTSMSFVSSYIKNIPEGVLIRFTTDDGDEWNAVYTQNTKTKSLEKFLGYASTKQSTDKTRIYYVDKESNDNIEYLLLGFPDNCRLILKRLEMMDRPKWPDNKIRTREEIGNLELTVFKEALVDDETCKRISSLNNLIDEMNSGCEYQTISIANNKYSNNKIEVPYMKYWINKDTPDAKYYYLIDREGFSYDSQYTGVRRNVYVPINSPMTISKSIPTIDIDTKSDDYTRYFDDVLKSDFLSTKRPKYSSYNLEDYINLVNRWKEKNYKSIDDPRVQSSINIEKLAKAINQGGELNPMKLFSMTNDKIYKNNELIYNGEEMSYYLFGYAASQLLNFDRVEAGQAFAMQHLNSPQYSLRTAGEITDAPWLIKAFNQGWIAAQSVAIRDSEPISREWIPSSMYTPYTIAGGWLTDGWGWDDTVEVAVWVTGVGGVKKMTVKIARNMVISAYINWQVQIFLRMICEGETFEEAASRVNYSDVTWTAITSALENDKAIMALECIKSGVKLYRSDNYFNIGDQSINCAFEIAKHQSIKRLLADKNSIYGKYIYETLKKRDHSKTEFLRQICIVFNCHSDTALEIMRIIPSEIIASMHGELTKEEIERVEDNLPK